MKNCNAFDFTHKYLKHTNKCGGGLCICTFLRPPLVTYSNIRYDNNCVSRKNRTKVTREVL